MNINTKTLTAAILSACLLAAGGSALAQDAMKKDAMGKDAMSKDAMAKDGMKKDAMAKDAMGKDAMAKDGMKHDDKMAMAKKDKMMKKDHMAKDGMKKDAMAKDAMGKDAMGKDGDEEIKVGPGLKKRGRGAGARRPGLSARLRLVPSTGALAPRPNYLPLSMPVGGQHGREVPSGNSPARWLCPGGRRLKCGHGLHQFIDIAVLQGSERHGSYVKRLDLLYGVAQVPVADVHFGAGASDA